MAWMLRAAPWATLVWGALILVDAAFAALRLWATRGTVNAVVAFVRAPSTTTSPLRWFAIIATVEAGARLAGLVRPYIRELVRVRAGASIQRAVLTHAARIPVEAFDVEATHDLVRRVGDGADTRGPDLVGETLGLIQQVPTLVVNALYLGAIALWLPLAAAAMEAVFIWQMIAQGARERRFEVDWTRRRRLTDYYAALLTSRAAAAEIRLWDLRPELLRRWREGQRAYAVERHGLALRETHQYLPSTVAASGFLVAAVAILSATHGRIEPGLAALFLTALFNLMGGMNMTQQAVRRFVGHAGYAADLHHMLEGLGAEDGVGASPAQGAPPSAARPRAPGAAVGGGRRFPCPIREAIRLHGVSYRYPGAAADALTDVDLEIRPGDVVALVGANGAGKTTLAALLLGLRRPTAGRITVDGTDLISIPSSEVRAACAAVFQQPVRYPGTLRENVALAGAGTVDAGADHSLDAALGRAGLSDWSADPDRLLSPEMGGADLSGGQWQRLSIARALFRPEAQLLVFDEPTAALDPLAELALFERFAALAAGRTALLISHRLGPTRLADLVVVLEGGRIVEQGPPHRLLAEGGHFARMFAAQAEGYR